ncbi:hypothetical protein [Streptomyces cyaneofuscatus]|uniref:hypothetical protein n=1 Tax=Streptomyces cyaneofuscatus TaxID=66883 RepID=UPI0033AAB258
MAERIHVRGEGGQVIEMDLPLPEPIADRFTKGYLRRVNADGSPYTGTALTAEDGPPPESGGSALTNGVPPRPGKNASKATWVGWAVTVHGLEPDRAEDMTKGDLMELPDVPADPAAPGAGRGGKPGEDAPKGEWIAYVVSQGHLSADDAATLTKDDLIDLVK